MERAEAHLPSYAFFCWWCIHLGCKISFDVSCADDMTGKQAEIELCAVPFFRRAFQVYDTLNTARKRTIGALVFLRLSENLEENLDNKLLSATLPHETIPGTYVQHPGLQGGGALGDA